MHAPSPAPLLSPAIGHRADIDGLRALAILPVLLFHAHVPGFGGGYVGVDIFFVLSGYLITRILVREIDEGRFSLLRFYERRFRRIMPALALVVLVVLLAAIWLYLPGDFEGVPKSALAATLFASNLWFFTDTGYFAGGADVKPLLHTWSLAVEEQYYIGFPILLLAVSRTAPRWRTLSVAVLAALSLALALAMQRDVSGFTFYLPPARAWELLAGALLALGVVPALHSRLVRESISWAGVAAIMGAVLFYDRQTPFPGLAALPPVLGAAALIHAAPGTSVGRLLSTSPMVGIGLISYSLYLWHWPLIVFTEYATDAPIAGATRLLVLAAALAAATLSWRYVETPFRNVRQVSARSIWIFTAGAMALLGGLSLILIAQGGWASRFTAATLTPLEGRQDISPHRKRCHDTALRGEAPCVLGAPRPADRMLWGDSHGVELSHVLSRRAMAQGHALIERTTSSCPPVLDYVATDPRCAAANRDAFDALRADPRIRRVYLAAFWATDAFDDPAFVARLDRTIAEIRALGRDVVVIGPVPPQPFDVPRRLAHAAMAGVDAQASGVDAASVKARTAHLRAALDRWRARGVTVIDPIATLCGSGTCLLEQGGKPLYCDSHHLSVTGAERVIQGR